MRFIFLLIVSCSLLYNSSSQAQTVHQYARSTGLLKGTFSTVRDAVYVAVSGDSLVMSAHTFREYNIGVPLFPPDIVLQGTILGKDTSTIDGQGLGNVFVSFKGTIRDVVLTGGRPAILKMAGRITGNTTIRHNVGHFTIGFYEGSIEGNTRIIHNITDTGSAPIALPSPEGFATTSNVVIRDNVLIAHNKGGIAGAIVADGVTAADSAFIRNKFSLKIEGNVRIENNEGSRAGAILFWQGGRSADISGATIINNRVSRAGWGGAISVDSFQVWVPWLSYDSVGVPDIRLSNVRMYNPGPGAVRQLEVVLYKKDFRSNKPCRFSGEACWWGDSDTSGLIRKDAGTFFSLPSWAVTNWYCLPFSTTRSKVLSAMRLNSGGALPLSSLQSIEGQFSSSMGSFSSGSSLIDAFNVVSSELTYPGTGILGVVASIDADTFRPSLKQLHLKEPGFEAIRVYPNPATSLVSVSGLLSGSRIFLYDLSGKMLLDQEALMPQSSINISFLAPGQYILKVQTKEGRSGSLSIRKE